MDASRYFDAMHNAMSTQHVGAQLLLTVRLQDTCGNDAYLEVKQLPGEQSALVCYSTMGRRCLNFQLFRKGWHRSQWKVTLAAVHAGATGIRTLLPACRWAQFCTGWQIFWPGTSAAPSSLTRRLPHWLRSGWQRTLLCSSAPPLP